MTSPPGSTVELMRKIRLLAFVSPRRDHTRNVPLPSYRNPDRGVRVDVDGVVSKVASSSGCSSGGCVLSRKRKKETE